MTKTYQKRISIDIRVEAIDLKDAGREAGFVQKQITDTLPTGAKLAVVGRIHRK